MEKTNWRRTDLIDETDEVVVHKTKEQKETLEHTDGVIFKEKQFKRVKITNVTVNDEGAREVQKAKGEYITLSVPTLTIEDEQGFQQLEKTVIESLDDLHESIQVHEKRGNESIAESQKLRYEVYANLLLKLK